MSHVPGLLNIQTLVWRIWSLQGGDIDVATLSRPRNCPVYSKMRRVDNWMWLWKRSFIAINQDRFVWAQTPMIFTLQPYGRDTYTKNQGTESSHYFCNKEPQRLVLAFSFTKMLKSRTVLFWYELPQWLIFVWFSQILSKEEVRGPTTQHHTSESIHGQV
jgi:hypothetical protein